MTATAQTTASFYFAYCARSHIKKKDKPDFFMAEVLWVHFAIQKAIRFFRIRGS